MANFSTAIVLETRTPRKDGTFPVKLRVTIDRKARYYSLDKHLTQAEYEDVFDRKTDKKRADKKKDDKNLKKIAAKLREREIKAIELLESMEMPSFDQFKRLFTMKGTGGNVSKYYRNYIQECKKENRHGTASSYECSYNSLNDVKGIETASFREITPAWLKDYESKMKAKGKTYSTIGIYIRPLRKLFNDALRDGVIHEKLYPFGDPKSGKYQIPKSSNNKRPLEFDELEALESYTGSTQNEMYRDFFLLSYQFNGLNFMDLLTLKWKQLNGDILTVVRKKTENTTRRNQTSIKIYVTEESYAIINKYGNPAGTYIFDIISDKDEPAEIRRKVQNFNRNTNQALKAIAKNTPGINKRISTVFARHSFISHAIDAGIALPVIQEGAGHGSIKTTSGYAKSLGKGYIDLAKLLSRKRTVPKTERGTNADENQQQQGFEAVPFSVPVER